MIAQSRYLPTHVGDYRHQVHKYLPAVGVSSNETEVEGIYGQTYHGMPQRTYILLFCRHLFTHAQIIFPSVSCRYWERAYPDICMHMLKTFS